MKKTSTTNILAKIFKKTPEKKVKKKVSTKIIKKPKPKEIKKNISKTKSKGIKPKIAKSTVTKIKKNLKTVTTKPAPQKVEVKTDNLRISKSNEVKPEIKKVKKQETEKKRIQG